MMTDPAGSVIINHSPHEIICADCKVYSESELQFSVSQIEELGFDNFWTKAEELNVGLEAYRASENLLASFLLITDINSQSSILIVASEPELKEQINYPRRGQSNFYDLKGIVSRKKQLIPYITTLLKTSGIIGS